MATQQTSPLLGPDDSGRPVSAEEYAEARFVEPWTYEREDGRLLVESPEGQRHLDDSKPWRLHLSRYWIEHPEVVEELVIQAWARVDQGTDRIGDIGIYLAAEHPGPPIPERIPDVMFEVVSPGRESRNRDYVRKRRDYFRLGVREYVVIDSLRRKVTVFTRGPNAYWRRTLRPGEVYRTPLLPGLAIPLNEVF